MRAVFLGRFQPLHKGHYLTIDRYRDRYDALAIAIGSPLKSRTEENPLNLRERKKLLNDCFPSLEKIPVRDEDRGGAGYPTWASRLEKRTEADTIVTGNEKVQRIVREHTGMEVEEQELVRPGEFSGTEIRRRMREGESWKQLVPECSRDRTEKLEHIFRETG